MADNANRTMGESDSGAFVRSLLILDAVVVSDACAVVVVAPVDEDAALDATSVFCVCDCGSAVVSVKIEAAILFVSSELLVTFLVVTIWSVALLSVSLTDSNVGTRSFISVVDAVDAAVVDDVSNGVDDTSLC